MAAEDAAADDDQGPERSRSAAPEPRDPWGIVEAGLQIVGLYFSYKGDEAATFTVTAFIEIIRLMRR